MEKIKLIKAKEIPKEIYSAINESSQYFEDVKLNIEDDYKNSRVLILLHANEIGMDFEVMNFLNELYKKDNESFKNSYVGLIVYSKSSLYTKKVAKEVIFIVNSMGATIIGQPLIEVIGGLENLKKWSKYLKLTKTETLKYLVNKLVNRLLSYEKKYIEKPKLLVLHANSNIEISNTHLLWKEVSEHLNIDYSVIHVEDGTVLDCRGCSFKTCIYYAEKNSCFYGGVMVKEILPAIEEADAILWLLPNYNDAISAKLMAVINRLTVLYRKHPLLDKNIFAIAVSGNSGSDSVIRQLIGALNINKGFRLPPKFYIHAIANDAREILNCPDFEKTAKQFALHINEESHWI